MPHRVADVIKYEGRYTSYYSVVDVVWERGICIYLTEKIVGPLACQRSQSLWNQLPSRNVVLFHRLLIQRSLVKNASQAFVGIVLGLKY